MTDAKLLKVAAVAKELDCSLTNVYALISTGSLRAIRTGAGGKGYRIHRSELDRYIADGPATLPKKVPVRDGVSRKLKVLDGDAMQAAWRRRDAAVAQRGVSNTQSVPSECGQAAAPTSPNQHHSR